MEWQWDERIVENKEETATKADEKVQTGLGNPKLALMQAVYGEREQKQIWM